MSPEESQHLLEVSKKGQKNDLLIKVPARDKKTYELSLEYIKNTLSHIDKNWHIEEGFTKSNKENLFDLWKALSGIVFFGSAVGAKYHNLSRRRFGIFKKIEKVLVYDRGREPNDIDILFILDDDEIKKQEISIKEEQIPVVHDAIICGHVHGSYSGWRKVANIAKGELDMVFTSESYLKECLQKGNPLAHHIRDAGVLAIGKCPIELRSPNFFKSTREELVLQFATV